MVPSRSVDAKSRKDRRDRARMIGRTCTPVEYLRKRDREREVMHVRPWVR